MATGYTHDLPETLEAFALRCAGLDVEESQEEITPETTHHDRNLAADRRELKRVERWTDTEATQAADGAYWAEVGAHRRIAAKYAEMEAKYDAMLAKVRGWTPPSKDHQGLKQFMLEQLLTSKCADAWMPSPPIRLTGAAFRQKKIERLREDIAYHEEQRAAAIKAAQDRATWMRMLRESLRQEATR